MVNNRLHLESILMLLLFILLLSGCTTNQSLVASDYENDLKAPESTKSFVLVSREVFKDPLDGIALSYIDKLYPSDNIRVNVYPINSINWQDTESILDTEMINVLGEIDMAVKQGIYRTREKDVKSNFGFSVNGQYFEGKKSHLKIISGDGVPYFSNIFLFLQEDKFIKFQTSVDANVTKEWTGDAIVKELLPLISVPSESRYMSELREAHRERISQQFLQLILNTSDEVE